jgi:hypothetical protein
MREEKERGQRRGREVHVDEVTEEGRRRMQIRAWRRKEKEDMNKEKEIVKIKLKKGGGKENEGWK